MALLLLATAATVTAARATTRYFPARATFRFIRRAFLVDDFFMPCEALK